MTEGSIDDQRTDSTRPRCEEEMVRTVSGLHIIIDTVHEPQDPMLVDYLTFRSEPPEKVIIPCDSELLRRRSVHMEARLRAAARSRSTSAAGR
jgi:hypothetical protein